MAHLNVLICTERGQVGAVPKSNKNPEVNILTLQDPVTAPPFTLFYSWDNGSKTSIQDLLEMGQDVAFYLVLDRLNKVESENSRQ